ncbi:MAG: sensor histidine kinase [Pseudomonadota bacterium]|nr:sensor histidine kinase [Pseudomonadota bacterium]
MASSLRGRLLAWVMLPLAGAVAVDGLISHRNASTMAILVQERLLLGSARIVAEQLRFEDGALQAHIPPAALELFDSGADDHVYYRVTTAQGETIAGYGELPVPAAPLQPEVPVFLDATVRGSPVHLVALLQPVPTDAGIRPVLVEIAETLNGYGALKDSLWLQAMGQQLIILALVAALMVCGLRLVLRPLLRLRDAILRRDPGTMEPLELQMNPSELAPLIVAINEYAQRLDQHARAQGAFIQNAAHQLRTPLTLLTTQVSFASRTTAEEARAESLAAIRQTVQQSSHLVNQLLTLSTAEARHPDEDFKSVVALDLVVRQVLENLSGQAQAKGIDIGFEMTEDQDALVLGNRVALREIAMNLIDNAIRYTQPGGVVTGRLSTTEQSVTLCVEDNGPGIPVALRERVLERFYRIENTDSAGCGLGLPIALEFATRMQATLRLSTPPSGIGLAAEVTFARVARTHSVDELSPVDAAFPRLAGDAPT